MKVLIIEILDEYDWIIREEYFFKTIEESHTFSFEYNKNPSYPDNYYAMVEDE